MICISKVLRPFLSGLLKDPPEQEAHFRLVINHQDPGTNSPTPTGAQTPAIAGAAIYPAAVTGCPSVPRYRRRTAGTPGVALGQEGHRRTRTPSRPGTPHESGRTLFGEFLITLQCLAPWPTRPDESPQVLLGGTLVHPAADHPEQRIGIPRQKLRGTPTASSAAKRARLAVLPADSGFR